MGAPSEKGFRIRGISYSSADPDYAHDDDQGSGKGTIYSSSSLEESHSEQSHSHSLSHFHSHSHPQSHSPHPDSQPESSPNSRLLKSQSLSQSPSHLHSEPCTPSATTSKDGPFSQNGVNGSPPLSPQSPPVPKFHRPLGWYSPEPKNKAPTPMGSASPVYESIPLSPLSGTSARSSFNFSPDSGADLGPSGLTTPGFSPHPRYAGRDGPSSAGSMGWSASSSGRMSSLGLGPGVDPTGNPVSSTPPATGSPLTRFGPAMRPPLFSPSQNPTRQSPSPWSTVSPYSPRYNPEERRRTPRGSGTLRSSLGSPHQSIPIGPGVNNHSPGGGIWGSKGSGYESEVRSPVEALVRALWSRHRETRHLALLISMNVTYFLVELLIGLLTGRVELVSDAFHLSFGCLVLILSLVAMVWGSRKADAAYTYGYGRLDVLAAFTNALFLVFLSFSLSVEALHAFVENEAEHKHYLIVSAVANLLLNLLGVFFFRSHARVKMTYGRQQDINHHSIFLHVVSDSVRSAGIILASWLLAIGVGSADALCLGLVAGAILCLSLPLLRTSGGLLLQMTPAGISDAALHRCVREVASYQGVLDCHEERFWAMVPGYIVGTLSLKVDTDVDEQLILQHVHRVFNEIGVSDLTVQIEKNVLSSSV